MKRLLLASALLLGAGPALADNPQFQTPSGNIGCEYQANTDDRLYCVRLEPTMSYIEFYADKAYTGDYEGDAWFPEDAKVLAYGDSLSLGPYTCWSETSGLTCERGQRGFTANRKGIRTY